MRRLFVTLILLLTAATGWAVTPYYLDRTGVLWKAITTPQGLLLTGERDGQGVVSSVVPFGVGLNGTSDTDIQVAADDLTGKIAVVWQRNWSAQVSEIIVAVWKDGDWERIEHLTTDLASQPRFPLIQLAQVSSTVADPSHPDDAALAQTVRDSFLNVVWWEAGGNPHASIASLRLSTDPGVTEPVVRHNLDEFAALGLSCATDTPNSLLQHPLFASQLESDRVFVLFGSQHICVFQLLQVQFVYQAVTGDGAGINVTAQRGRHIPIFGVKKVFPMIQDFSMEGTRVILGGNMNPIAYRVDGPTIQYLTCSDQGWSPARTLAVTNGLTLDQAIPLVENLAR
jgi:hypothetical protein